MPRPHLERLSATSRAFLRIGCLSFGGPFVAVAMMEEEFVRRRKWLSPEKFAELYAICKLLPGPVAAQMAIAIAKECAGRLAGLLAGVLYILPAFGLVVGIAALYRSGHELPKQAVFFHGLQVGAIAAIAVSVWQLFRPVVGEPRAWILAILNAGATLLHPALEPLYILGTGLAGVWLRRVPGKPARPSRRLHGLLATAVVAGAGPAAGSLLPTLFGISFKAGALVFGTGLAILPILEDDFVGRYGLITHSQFLDALAVGQVTPGPISITATFVGYLVAGIGGALATTAGIFLPSFINVLILVPIIWKKLSKSPSTPTFVAWALPAVVGCIFAASVKLGLLTVSRPVDYVLLTAGIAALLSKRVPSWAVILGAGFVSATIS